MAVSIIFRVGDTSAQDIYLTSSGVAVLSYPLDAPDIDQQAIDNLGDGNSLSVPSFRNVTETIELHISAATAALVQDKVRAIERLLDLARQGTLGQLDNKLYIALQFDSDTEAWRSQVLAAKMEILQGTDQIWRKYVQASLTITRRYYWETADMQSIEVSSGTTTTATTGYASVFNADDTHATQRNWFQIAADQIGGSLPTPAKIYIKNLSGSSKLVRQVHLGNYLFSGNTTVDPVFRVEAASGFGGVFSTLEDAAFYWSLSTGDITDSFRGQHGRIIVVWADRPASTTLVRAALQLRFPIPDFDIALAEQTLNTPQDWVQDIGSLPLPPSNAWADMGTVQYIAIKGKTPTGTDTVDVDWMQVFPTGAGRYRLLKGILSIDLEDDEEVVDDGPNDAAYALSGGNAIPVFRPLFSPIHLWPGKLQRLRIVIGTGSFTMETGAEWGISVQTRFRRLGF